MDETETAVPVTLPTDVILILSLQAHELNITLNQHIKNIVLESIRQEEIARSQKQIEQLRERIHKMCEHTDGGCRDCPVYDECDAPGKEEEEDEGS